MFPSTIPEFATALGADKADVAAAVLELEREGDLERNGRRSRDVVYRGRP